MSYGLNLRAAAQRDAMMSLFASHGVEWEVQRTIERIEVPIIGQTFQSMHKPGRMYYTVVMSGPMNIAPDAGYGHLLDYRSGAFVGQSRRDGFGWELEMRIEDESQLEAVLLRAMEHLKADGTLRHFVLPTPRPGHALMMLFGPLKPWRGYDPAPA